ncbi:uncharacterized protein G2W53_027601 [Senna tora]|uniref:Uncharacterized protein n=1 Tax=Senna tora TaxID=362788 RepID=A0A834TJT2_9FABA|nr:uncharacterized protein G2W53_027601 [Senna tora]
MQQGKPGLLGDLDVHHTLNVGATTESLGGCTFDINSALDRRCSGIRRQGRALLHATVALGRTMMKMLTCDLRYDGGRVNAVRRAL